MRQLQEGIVALLNESMEVIPAILLLDTLPKSSQLSWLLVFSLFKLVLSIMNRYMIRLKIGFTYI